jgi:hypothetical protein
MNFLNLKIRLKIRIKKIYFLSEFKKLKIEKSFRNYNY